MEFEKLGVFYLGKEYDTVAGELLEQSLMYDARDLTTHAVCVGMTGSGKTGLCIDVLEEAAIDQVPAIIIDPKGDITNLLLTFPDLLPEDFRPWINVDDARRKGLSEAEFSAQQAELWRNGLADWGQDGDRIRLLRESAEFVIYTPGSEAGVPVSILQSFAASGGNWGKEAELLRERVQGTVSAILGLIGVDADPVRSREYILLANLFEHYWRQGEDLDLPKLILSIQKPPLRRLGVFDVETFFPEKDRFELAMNLNNLIASPGFQSWLQGQALDVAGFLSTSAGKPRHSIFYIAHLSDAERMFFVTMLLNQIIAWMRAQPGTTSLRGLLYMDEIFGFFPPVANPPSKQPMLTLLKQARAFGLGVVLTTQNPVDLDYKGLTNAGTWFIGRLQTERDKMRVLDGLESASAAAGGALDRGSLSELISSLGKRVFLLHNVHEETPVTFQTRWAMSYLRGPLTRSQVRDLMADEKADQPALAPIAGTGLAPSRPEPIAPAQPAVVGAGASPLSMAPPAAPSRVDQVFLPLRRSAAVAQAEIETRIGRPLMVQRANLVYEPAVLGIGRVHFVDQRREVDEREDFALLVQPPDGTGVLRWDRAQALDIAPRDLVEQPETDAYFDDLPVAIDESTEFTALKTNLADYLYRTSALTLLHSPVLEIYSHPRESERDFRMRLQQAIREARDEEVDAVTTQYDRRLRKLEDRMRRAEATVAKKEADAEARKREVLVSVGESVLGVFFGRRSTRAASSALSKYRQSGSAESAVEGAREDVAAVQRDIDALEAELRHEADAIKTRWNEALETLEEFPVTPRRSDIDIDLFALAWAPHWYLAYKDDQGGDLTEVVQAY